MEIYLALKIFIKYDIPNKNGFEDGWAVAWALFDDYIQIFNIRLHYDDNHNGDLI